MIEKTQQRRASEARSSADVGRRRLLQGMASGGGALALVAIAGETPRSGADGSADGRKRLSFKATDHVRWYYRRARW